jgi:hypothetical protein
VTAIGYGQRFFNRGLIFARSAHSVGRLVGMATTAHI